MKVEVYTSKPEVQLSLWDSNSKINYDEKFSEFSSLSVPLHPSILAHTVIGYLENAFLSHIKQDDYVVAVIAYSQVIFNACRVFKHDMHIEYPDHDVKLNIHVVDNSDELFEAQVLNSGKIIAPIGCDLDGVFDEYDRTLDILLDLDTSKYVYRNGVITDPLPDNQRDCSTCAYREYNWPEAGSMNRCTGCHHCSNYKKEHNEFKF